MSELEDRLDERSQREDFGWILSEDFRTGPATPPLRFHADGRMEKVRDDTRWWSACAFQPATKEIIAVTEEVHGGESARDTALRQLLERLDAAGR